MTSQRQKRAPSELGQRLKLVRESAGIDDEALSAAAGLSRTHVHSIEVGWILNPRTETVLVLAQVLGAPLDYLVAGRGRPPTPGRVKAAFKRATQQQAQAQA